MQILMTGATGFLGRYIVEALLAEGHTLTLLVRNEAAARTRFGDRVRYAAGDVLDIESLLAATTGQDLVLHAAAVVSFHKGDRDAMMQINVQGTENVVNACLETGVPRLVHLSSTAAVGHTENPADPITEETKWTRERTSYAYSVSKYKAELEAQRGVAEGLHVLILNPGVILGIGDWKNGTPKFFSVVNKGLRFYNAGTISVVGAADVAHAAALMVARPDLPTGERYLLVAETLPQRDLFAQIARAIGKNPPTIGLKPWMSLLVGRISEILAKITGTIPIISLDTMRSSIAVRRYDASKITRLGLRYTPVSEVITEVGNAFVKEH